MKITEECSSELIEYLQTVHDGNASGFSIISDITPIFVAGIALGSAVIALRIYRQSKKIAEAQLVLTANEKYTKLKQSLAHVGNWSDDRRNADTIKKLQTLDPKMDWKAAIDSMPITEAEWENNHEIKNYFKGYFRLYDNDKISKDILLLCINHFGYNLLLNTVILLDKYRYFYARKGKFDVVKDREFLKMEFENEFRWYKKLEGILSRYTG